MKSDCIDNFDRLTKIMHMARQYRCSKDFSWTLKGSVGSLTHASANRLIAKYARISRCQRLILDWKLWVHTNVISNMKKRRCSPNAAQDLVIRAQVSMMMFKALLKRWTAAMLNCDGEVFEAVVSIFIVLSFSNWDEPESPWLKQLWSYTCQRPTSITLNAILSWLHLITFLILLGRPSKVLSDHLPVLFHSPLTWVEYDKHDFCLPLHNNSQVQSKSLSSCHWIILYR